jgi:hypothetical protein
MPSSPRSTFIPHPCTRTEELHNWQALHRLVGRLPLEPTDADDGKLLRWSNSQQRFLLISPCQAIVDCGGSGGECTLPCEHASGITPKTKTASFGGSLVETGCDGAQEILSQSPFVLICDGPCRYTYLDMEFNCGGMTTTLALTIDVFATESVLTASIGALTGGVVWKKTGLTAPFDMETEINGSYALHENLSSQFDATNLTATISA